MKYNMANNEYFDVGMKLEVTNRFREKFHGEVTAFDAQTKTMVLKTPTGNGRHTVRLVNVEQLLDLSVVKEATEPPPPLPTINLAKVYAKYKANVEDKQRKVNYVGVGVTSDAQRLFMHITKTYDDTKWDDKDIVVLDQVRIKHPYSRCESNSRNADCSTAISHVQKVVDKYYGDQASRESSVQRESS